MLEKFDFNFIFKNLEQNVGKQTLKLIIIILRFLELDALYLYLLILHTQKINKIKTF